MVYSWTLAIGLLHIIIILLLLLLGTHFKKKKYIIRYVHTDTLIFRTTFTCPWFCSLLQLPKPKGRMLPSGMFPSIISFYFLSFCVFLAIYSFYYGVRKYLFSSIFKVTSQQMACLTNDLRNLHRFHIIFWSLRDQHICNTYKYITVRVTPPCTFSAVITSQI